MPVSLEVVPPGTRLWIGNVDFAEVGLAANFSGPALEVEGGVVIRVAIEPITIEIFDRRPDRGYMVDDSAMLSPSTRLTHRGRTSLISIPGHNSHFTAYGVLAQEESFELILPVRDVSRDLNWQWWAEDGVVYQVALWCEAFWYGNDGRDHLRGIEG